MMKSILVMVGVVAVVLSGCATSFTGEAHVPGGPAGCETKCRGWGLEFVGMVAMGEYSDACVCRRPGLQASVVEGAGSATGGAAGVIMQMRRAEEQRRASMH